MKFKVILGGVLIAFLGSSVVWAGKPWKGKPYTEWTEKEVTIVLNDSPWVRKATPGWGPGRSSGSRYGKDASTTIDTSLGETTSRIKLEVAAAEFRIQWVSSLTLREAGVRSRQLQGNIDDKEAAEILSQTPGEHIILVRGTIRDKTTYLDWRQFEMLTEQTKQQSVGLKLSQSKQTIHPTRVEFSLPYGNMRIMVARFYFPRELASNPVIGPGEKKVTFSWRWKGYKIQAKFDLRKMTRDGKPDL